MSRKQAEFLGSKATHVLFCAGVGSGKTASGALWAMREALSGGGLGFIGANTYQQLTRATLRAFTSALDRSGLEYVFGVRPPRSWGHSPFQKHDMVCSINLGGEEPRQIVCSQLGTYDYLRGIEFRWIWIDETRDTKREAFDVLIGRLRGGPHDAARRIAVTTTPNGFTWLHGRFVAHGPEALPDREVIYATSHDNPWLPPNYVERLLQIYSPRLAQQEVEGKFISLASGQAFAEFDRALHVIDRFIYRPSAPLIHTFDYNVNPMCSCILQADKTTGAMVCFDEIHIEGSARTRDVTSEFLRRYGKHRGTVEIYGDASGHSRDTRGTRSDFDIIEDEYRPVFGGRLEIAQSYSNPAVWESVQDVNSLLLNSKGVTRLRFHRKCEHTIRDMEQVAFKPGSRELDKSDRGLTHHSDAIRYYVSLKWPARRGRGTGGLTPAGW